VRWAVSGVGLRCGHRPDGRGRARLGWTSCPTRLPRTSMSAGHPRPPGRRKALWYSCLRLRRAGRVGGEEPSSRSLGRSANARLRDDACCRSGFSRDREIRRSRLKPLLQEAPARSRDQRTQQQLGAELFSSPSPGAPRTKIENKRALHRPGGVGASSGTGRPRGECGQAPPEPKVTTAAVVVVPRQGGARTVSRQDHPQPRTARPQ